MGVRYGDLAYSAAVEHVRECIEAKRLRDEGQEVENPPLTAGEFCGCHECVIRETLFASWAYIFWSSNSPDTPVPKIPEPLQEALMHSRWER